MALAKQALNTLFVKKESLNTPNCFLRAPNRLAARRSLLLMALASSNSNNKSDALAVYALRGFQAFWFSSVFYIDRQPKSGWGYSKLPKFNFRRYGFTMTHQEHFILEH